MRGSIEALAGLLHRLRPVSNLEAAVSWQDAVQSVAAGDAVFTIMGDWAWAQLDPEDRAVATALPFPGTAGTFVYTPDRSRCLVV